MRETVRGWRDEWIETNGYTEDLEVVISDSSLGNQDSYAYEGSFRHIPECLLHRRVIQCGQILESSVEERNGAYSLTV